MTNLSPAAQAVLDAYQLAPIEDELTAAAVLRAAADQHTAMELPFSVITDWEKVKGSCASFYAAAEWGYYQALRDVRAIATELETAS